MTCIIRAYVPINCDAGPIKSMMLYRGGYTVTQGRGFWSPDGGFTVSECCHVFECVADYDEWQENWVTEAGEEFLRRNPREQAFLAVIIGAKVSKIYIERKEHERKL